MKEIKIGDVVYLNSNPEIKLTVTKLYENHKDHVGITFFNPVKGEFSYVNLPTEAITVVKREG